MSRDGLTITIIMRAESANYGESFGNIAPLKKVSRGDHHQYSYISRQALRYSIVHQLKWDDTVVSMDKNKKVVQFAPDATIEDYPEIDLFGYMKTEQGKGAKTRSAVARLSNAIALEPFVGDLDYLTNMGLARRKNYENGIAQSEIQASYYAYTLTIDLDRVGKEENKDEDDRVIEIERELKAERVGELLDAIQFLYRDIRGRRENLAPLFVIGGVFERKIPYFLHRVSVKNNEVLIDPIKETMDSCDDAKKNTRCGVLADVFTNNGDIKTQLNATSINEFFKRLKEDVIEYYEVENCKDNVDSDNQNQ